MALFNRKPASKKFKIDGADIQRLLPYDIACFATDKITVEGLPVGWFYRDLDGSQPNWIFMSGTESQPYMDDPKNTAIYSLNTIANYDPEIIPFLGAPRGSAFERKSPGAGFTPIPDWVSPTD
jgi:hypothetical protein